MCTFWGKKCVALNLDGVKKMTFLARRVKKRRPKGQSSPQELEVRSHSGRYLLVRAYNSRYQIRQIIQTTNKNTSFINGNLLFGFLFDFMRFFLFAWKPISDPNETGNSLQ